MKSPRFTNKTEELEGREKYLSRVEGLLKGGKEKDALLILKHALKEMPDDPFLLSYHGCLIAIVERKAALGAKACKNAIEIVKKSGLLGEFIHPLFYLNLGRCYHIGGRKKKAIETLKEGLRMDAQDPDILHELQRMGVRKKPPLSFLPRSNPMNKYIGFLISRLKD